MTTSDWASLLAGVAGVILSIVAEFVPAYQNLTDAAKRGVMAAAIILVAGAVYGLTCAAWLIVIFPDLTLTCDQAGLAVLIRAILFVLMGNQATFSLLFRGKDKKVFPAYIEGQ